MAYALPERNAFNGSGTTRLNMETLAGYWLATGLANSVPDLDLGLRVDHLAATAVAAKWSTRRPKSRSGTLLANPVANQYPAKVSMFKRVVPEPLKALRSGRAYAKALNAV